MNKYGESIFFNAPAIGLMVGNLGGGKDKEKGGSGLTLVLLMPWEQFGYNLGKILFNHKTINECVEDKLHLLRFTFLSYPRTLKILYLFYSSIPLIQYPLSLRVAGFLQPVYSIHVYL
jgi:hypothetical protein